MTSKKAKKTPVRVAASITDFDIDRADFRHTLIWVMFKTEKGQSVRLLGPVTADFVDGVMGSVGAFLLAEVVGKHCIITYTGDGEEAMVSKIEPITPDEGAAFDVTAEEERIRMRSDEYQRMTD